MENPLSNYKFVTIDYGKTAKRGRVTPEPREFEIWIGWYHLGQGYDPPTEPQLVATVKSVDFKTACLKHELESSLATIRRLEASGDYISNQQYNNFFSIKDGRPYDGWTGFYYETREEALKSFK